MKKSSINLGNSNKFVAFKTNGVKNCLNLCKTILKKYNLSNFGSSSCMYTLMKEHNNKLVYCGDNPKENYSNAIKCIDRHLENNRPIIVGVNHTFNVGNNEGTTDHFVVIYGRDYDDTLNCMYYMYYEVGKTDIQSGYNDERNRFIYKEGDNPEFFDAQSERLDHKRFDVIQVRPNDGKL